MNNAAATTAAPALSAALTARLVALVGEDRAREIIASREAHAAAHRDFFARWGTTAI